MVGPLTYLDVALLGLMGLSGLLAMYRGFTREVLSIVSWAAAAGAAVYFVFFQKAAAEKLAKDYLGSMDPKQATIIAQVGIGAGIFIIVLIIVHLITTRISDSILDSNVGMIDRLLGFVFGAVRGFVVVVILFMFYESFFPDPKSQYVWVREAKSRQYLQNSGETLKNVLVKFVPPSLGDPKPEPQGGGQQG